jgi:predicted HTH transcriptional regulator
MSKPYALRFVSGETFESAIREAIINAVVHNDYSYGATPKLEFFSDRAEVTSMGGLPYGVTEKDFFGGCSVPRNKEIMRVCRDLEIVEHLGSGVPRILKAYGKEAFEIRDSYVRIVFRFAKPISAVTGQVTPQVLALISVIHGEMDRETLQNLLGLSARKNFRTLYLAPALKDGLVEMTIPDKPNSRLQKYRLTDKGEALLKLETP